MTDRPRTPPLLYLLAALVVGFVYFAWHESRVSGERAQARWDAESLEADEIDAGLASDDFDHQAHALVQLARRLRGADGGLPEGFLEPLWPRLEALSRAPSRALRERLTPVLAYAPDNRAAGILTTMLRDDDERVALNAAIALAARGDAAGAGLIRSAIEGTRGEQAEQRRDFLMSFRHVAAEPDRAFLASELERARLDHDELRAGYCQDALDRLDGRDDGPQRR